MKLLLLTLALALAGAAPARADLLVDAGSFGSGARPAGFLEPSSIAVDDAGRVYVADAAAGHVEVFDSAPANNRFLLTLGEGKLVRPVAVAVDNRQRVYVADAGRNVIELYDAASRKFAPRGTLGGPGQALGQFDGPAGLVTDPTQRLFVTEQGNLRVSVFRPARKGGIVFQSAFGIGLPEPFLKPGPIARDSDGRMYIANADRDGGVRAFDRRGRYISPVGGTSPKSPMGVAVDKFDRVVISDTGGNRLLVYAPLQKGGALLETYTAPGIDKPAALALAPGALVYGLAGGRVVRLRFDDADTDGVADAGDNCLDLPNPNQAEADTDGRGDACDDDDDDDGKLDTADRCSKEAAAADDPDGCRDPLTRFLVPGQNRIYPVSPARFTGRSEGGDLGIERVEVAIGRRADDKSPLAAGAQCFWLDETTRKFTAPRACSRPIWFTASGRDSWRVALRPGFLAPGRYVAMARARQRQGPLEERQALGRNVRLFSVG
jgi:DNA-binding beta-propeller fold protein YncE